MTDILYKWLAIILGGLLWVFIVAFLGASIKAQFDTATNVAAVASHFNRLDTAIDRMGFNFNFASEQLQRHESRLDQLEQELVRLREAANYPRRRAK